MKIFYSWQSDSPSKTNRNLIEQAIKTAIKRTKADWDFKLEPAMDRDTRNLPGTPAISDSIFEKIRECDAFIADVTIITAPGSKRPIPNPNVLIELGYAVSEIGWDRIICIANTAYGSVEDMPFDLRHRRLFTYHLPDANQPKTERDKLIGEINNAIKDLQPRITPEIEYLSDQFHKIIDPLRGQILFLTWAYQGNKIGTHTSLEEFLYMLLRQVADNAEQISEDQLPTILVEKSGAFTLTEKRRWRNVVYSTKEISIKIDSLLMYAEKYSETHKGYYEGGAIEWLAKFYEQNWLPVVNLVDYSRSLVEWLDLYLYPKQLTVEEEKKQRDKLYKLNGSMGNRVELDEFFDKPETKKQLAETEQLFAQSVVNLAYTHKEVADLVWKLIELIKSDSPPENE